jgi:hypothetical protein
MDLYLFGQQGQNRGKLLRRKNGGISEELKFLDIVNIYPLLKIAIRTWRGGD